MCRNHLTIYGFLKIKKEVRVRYARFLIPSDDDFWLDKEKDRHVITTTTWEFNLSPPMGVKFLSLLGSFVFCYLLAEASRGYW